MIATEIKMSYIKEIETNEAKGFLRKKKNKREPLKMAPDELIELRDFFARQVLTEKRNERLRQKKGTGAKILADFR